MGDDELEIVPPWSMFPVDRFVVRGRVQGVGFRWWVYEQAVELRLLGHVFNRPDGAVEGVLAGDSFAIAAMVERLHEGPRAAVVTSVETEPVPAGSIPVPSAFTILRTPPS